MMKTFKVGGCVRDRIMGLKPNDIDYVITGATESDVEAMLAKGFTRVGNDFPVFLHPDSGDEYALARKERKVSAGYNGFEMYSSPDLTIEDDLIRRDLTINAIAIDTETGEMIDPFDGQSDIKSKILRHVSEAFAEDPLRVLRVARFAARFNDFKIAKSTMELMQRIVAAGEVSHLTKERVWAEIEKILSTKDPLRGFEVLAECNALQIIFPHIFVNLKTVPLRDTVFSNSKIPPEVKFALLARGMDTKFMQDVKIPTRFSKLTEVFSKNFIDMILIGSLEPDLQYEVMQRIHALKDRNFAMSVIDTLQGALEKTFGDSQSVLLERMMVSVNSVDNASVITPDMSGIQIGAAIKKARIEALVKFKAGDYCLLC